MGFFKGTQNTFELAVVNEPPVFEPLKVNCNNYIAGDVYKDYMGPAPPDWKAHYYYFLLYRQNTDFSLVRFMNYTGSCSEHLLGR